MKETLTEADFIEYLCERIKLKKVCFFLGAGISKNSGVPLAREFVSYIMAKLCDDLGLADFYPKYFENLMLPFELFIEILTDNSEDFMACYVEVLKSGKPNANHYLLSKLIKEGYVSEVLTTNFDLFLEDALSSNGAFFNVFFDEDQFRVLEKKRALLPAIYKIHGSADHPNSIRFTLRAIAGKTLLQSRATLLANFFEVVDRDIFFLGYSCSDEFDINVFLRNMSPSANIIYLKHSIAPMFSTNHLPYPFKGYNGQQITCNTDEVVDKLTKKLGYQITAQNLYSEDWKIVVGQWCDKLSKGTKYYILGRILSDATETEGSEKISQMGLERATEREKANIENTLARIALMKSDYDSSKVHLKRSLPTFEKYNEKMKVAENSFRLGWIEKRVGNYQEAKKHYEKSLNTSRQVCFQFGIAHSLTEIAMIYQREGNFKKAKEGYFESLSIEEEIGDLIGISGNLHQLGMIRRIERDFDEAEKILRRSLEIKTQVGNKSGMASSKGELALIYAEKSDYDSAKRLLDECLKLFEEIGDAHGISHCLHELGNLYFRKKDFNIAEEFYLKAIEIMQKISDKEGIANVYGQLGNIRMARGDREGAREYFKKCYQLHKEINNRHGMSLAKRCLDRL